MRIFPGTLGPLALLVAAACAGAEPPPPSPGAIPAEAVIGSSSIRGKALFRGEVPHPEEIDMGSDPVCSARSGGRTREDALVAADGSLQNVFVRIASGLGDRVFAPPQKPAVLDQDGCVYTPRVVGVQVNQILEIVNSDPTMHNVHSVPVRNDPFNVGMAVQGQRVRRFFPSPEVMVRVKCDLHHWMTAWVGVVEHPFFDVSGSDGGWVLEGLPAGRYTVEAWHERFGVRRAGIDVAEGESASLEFDFTR